MHITSGLYPQNVFKYFEEISKIPRGSGKEKQISDWLVKFAKDRNLEVYQDSFHNVIIKKEASKGYENYKPLILQGHIDMVWEKNKTTDFDFETEGIKLKIEDGFLKAEGTTLGADNGIAVAMCLAILDSNEIVHPKLEILLTSDEEVGMSGAENVDISLLDGKKMINIDTEEVGKVYVSSAGGATVNVVSKLENLPINEDENIFMLEILGLQGGHSGAEIHMPLGNSIKILADMLKTVLVAYEFNLILIDGGNKDNAIPREAMAYIATKATKEELKSLLDKFIEVQRAKFDKEEGLKYKLEEITDRNYRKISDRDTRKLVDLYNEFPHGVRTMSKNIEGLVQTSLNFGVLKTTFDEKETEFKIISLLRSSNIKELEDLQDYLLEIAKKHESLGEKKPSFYPWEYRENSTLRDLCIKTYEEMFNEKMEIKAIHAGLECGLFAEKISDLDVISFGPNIFGAHTPDEKMEISTVATVWDHLLALLKSYNLVD